MMVLSTFLYFYDLIRSSYSRLGPKKSRGHLSFCDLLNFLHFNSCFYILEILASGTITRSIGAQPEVTYGLLELDLRLLGLRKLDLLKYC